MKKLIMISVLASLALTGCSEPIDEASEIAQQACVADKNSDIDRLSELMNEEMFEMNKAMHQNSDPQMIRMLKMLNCDLKNAEVLEDGSFVVSFKKHNSYEVKELDGDFKIVGEQYF